MIIKVAEKSAAFFMLKWLYTIKGVRCGVKHEKIAIK